MSKPKSYSAGDNLVENGSVKNSDRNNSPEPSIRLQESEESESLKSFSRRRPRTRKLNNLQKKNLYKMFKIQKAGHTIFCR